MKRFRSRSLVVGAAALLALAAVATGPLAALLASPVAVGLGLLAWRLGRDTGPPPARALLAAGAAGTAMGLILAAFGPWLPGLLAAGLSAFVARLGLNRALAERPLEPSIAAASPRVAVALDEIALLGGTWVRRLGRGGSASELARAVRAAAERRTEAGWDEDPAAAHPRPPGLEKAAFDSVWLPGLGNVERLRVESEFEPFDAEVRDAWLAVAPNRTAHAFLARRGSAPRPTLVCVLPQRIGHPALGARLFAAERLLRAGLDVMLVPLPLEGPRAASRLGPRLLGAQPLWTSAGVAQALWDLRRLVGWLRANGAPAVGVAGLGAGGTVAALLAGLDARLVCAVLGAPVVSPVAHLCRTLPEPDRLAWAVAGVDDGLLEAVLAPSEPLRQAPHVAVEGRLLIAAGADRFVPSAEIRALRAHWEGAALHWLPGSHLSPRRDAVLYARLLGHLRATLVAAAEGPVVALTRFRSS
jgi:dienelactone hydrolase